MTIKLEIAGYLGWWGDSRVLAAVSDTTCHHAIAAVIYWHRLMPPDTGNTSPATNYTDQGRCLLIVLGTSWWGQPGLGWAGWDPSGHGGKQSVYLEYYCFPFLRLVKKGWVKNVYFRHSIDEIISVKFYPPTWLFTLWLVKLASIVQHGHEDCS